MFRLLIYSSNIMAAAIVDDNNLERGPTSHDQGY